MKYTFILLAIFMLYIANPTFAEQQSSSPISMEHAISACLQAPGGFTFNVGDLRITSLSDGTMPMDPHKFLKNITDDEINKILSENCLNNPVETSVNVFLIRMGTKVILVDTGIGDLMGPPMVGRLVSDLTALGIQPDQVTDVLITHMHLDHIGGLTCGGDRVFKHATIHIAKPDVDFFFDRSNAAKLNIPVIHFDNAIKTMKPYLDAGQVQTFTEQCEILPGITAIPKPSHTPGSAFYVAESKGQKIVFIGDVIHIGAIEFPKPDVAFAFDSDSNATTKIRKEDFSKFAEEKVLIAAPHLNFPGVGHVVAENDGFRWVPIEYTNRPSK